MAVRVVAAAAVAVAAGAAGGAAQAPPGVTPTSILIGGTAPLTGEFAPASGVARGGAAYFSWVNANGGVFGRRIVYRYVDDRHDSVRTVAAVRRLVERERVFAIFSTLGTETSLAVRDYLNQRRVPQLFVASGYAGFGDRRYPYTLGYIPTSRSEGMVYGRYLAQTKPAARIAVLYQDDEDGRDLLNGLRQGLGANAATIAKAVAVEPTTPNVDAEVAELRATRASVLAVFCFGRLFVQALVETKELGWRPTIVGNAVSSSPNVMQLATSAASGQQTIGTISVVFAKDPSDPAWRSDPGMKLFRQVLRQFVPGGNRADGFLIAGMASAFTFVDTLRKAGTDLTRAGLVRAAARLNEANNPFLLPGIVVRTGGNDRFPIEQMQLQRWNGKRWIRFGGLVTVG